MAWLPLLILSTYFMGTFSQFVLNQPASVSGSPGGTIRITCTTSSGTIGSGHSSWYQQKPSSAPKLLIYADSSRASGIPARFSGSVENSRTSAVLSISNLEAEDEGGYFCLSYAGSNTYTVLPERDQSQPEQGRIKKINLMHTIYISGTFSQVVLTQPESVAGSPGATIRITCTINSGTFGSQQSSWYQQKPGNVPKLMIYRDSSRASGIPERFSGSIENSKTSAVLTISNLQAEDEADYHCLTSDMAIPYTLGFNMAHAVLFFLVFSYCTGASAQFVLTQPASVSARLEGRVQISCTRSSGAMSGYYVSWYQQKSVEPPKLLIYQHVNRPADVPDRFSGVTDSSRATLTITGVQPEDEAEYYCQSYDGNWMFHSDATCIGK
ncbi:immunoglobulin kappa light chain-like [Pantherophis guttatus]|uniref:immunoglobulin kappa light chain-like n=1 Tax=Pantherophis guttatus TaxID=94885 RepID=UPI00295C2E25|nr:immunoglobulin kappa light chain-like [Pantherophis guttatus]